MKKYVIIIIAIMPWLFSCMKDKGNYDYTELAEIRVEGVPEVIEVLAFIDRIQVSPKIISSIEGEIRADNPNFTIQYRLGYKGMGSLGGVVDGQSQAWVDITPESGLDLDIPANYGPSTYVCWITITDNRNNTVTSHLFDIQVSSTTYEGWMVLCNEGPEERVRLDMISVLSSTNTTAIHDIANGLPNIHHATHLGFHPMQANPGAIISVFSEEGSYQLINSTLESSELMDFNVMGFVTPQPETMLYQYPMSVIGDYSWRLRYSFVISDEGNAYRQGHGEAGSMYGLPINTSVGGTAPEFKVAPFVGVSEVRPANSNVALFYDRDNKRFMGFNSATENILFPVADPQPSLFSFQTGKDMVYMEGTRRSNGLVYAILEDAGGQRSIYAINMGGNGFVQEDYYENVNAPGFAQATQFAFHSQFPIMFYATGNKVYLYNLGTRTAHEMTNIGLGASEEVTLLKFNLFRNSHLTNLNKQTPEFLNQQFQLIVGSYDQAASGVNGGKVGFYEVNGQSNTISQVAEYSGFAKVKDVVYRER